MTRWFSIPGEAEGRRTIDEQMMGLEPALAEAAGKSVMDLGAAEGCISIAFAKAGANVWACDNQARMIEAALELAKRLPAASRPVFALKDLRTLIQDAAASRPARYDIVLALAVIHKLEDPKSGVQFVANSARSLVVFRLPKREGVLTSKHSGVPCDVDRVMQRCGFKVERTLPGPRDEVVRYFRRVGG